ncbi:MAG: hypothetical protein II707_08470 [Spirochaetales bacterium]|nr:hypothetical protein [Spirochaetales bacterium]
MNMTADGLTADYTADLSADVSSNCAAKINLEYNIIAEFNGAPLMVTKDYSAFDFGGGVGFGVRFNKRWSVGLRFDADYYSVGADKSQSLSGAELSFRWLIIGAAQLTEWVSLYYGAGVSLLFSSYGRVSDGYVKQTAVGPSLWFEPRFYIPKFRYIDFAVPIQTDLGIANTLLPTVYGGGRINVHPYIQWLSLYVETAVRYTGYENEIVRSDMAQFVLSAGVTLDLFVGHKAKREGYSSAGIGMTVNESEMTDETDEISDKVLEDKE